MNRSTPITEFQHKILSEISLNPSINQDMTKTRIHRSHAAEYEMQWLPKLPCVWP